MAENGGAPVDFFISYTQADEKWAEWIRLELERAGYSTLVQIYDFPVGTNWVVEVHEAVGANRVIAVISRAYLASKPATAEWAALIAEDPVGKRRRFVPVRVEDFSPPGLLQAIVYVDLVGLGEKEARARLFSKLGLPIPKGGLDDDSAGPPIRFPGDIRARRWYVPHHRNPNFVDRDRLVERLDEHLNAAGAVRCAVVGMGGVGKTQVAAAYVNRYGEQYDAVWWVSAADRSALRRDYAALAQALRIEAPASDDPDELMAAVRRHIELDRGTWLLVFDDAFDPETSLDVMPSSNAKIVVTSRNQHWKRWPPILEVDVFDESVAEKFLLERSGDTDAKAASRLALELGRLPLALEQAAAFVGGSELFDLSGYLAQFQSGPRELLGDADSAEKTNVAKTFLVSFDDLVTKAPEAADLLCLLAFLAPDDIPIRLLLGASRAVPDLLGNLPGEPLSLDRAIGCLNQYSLLRKRVADALGVHRLVQTVLRAHLGPRRRAWAEAAVRLLGAEFPTRFADRDAWPQCARLLPHVLAATRFAEEEQAAPEETIQLLTRAGGYLRCRYDFANARDTLERAGRLAESTYQPALIALADTLEQVAQVFSNQRSLPEARSHLERALLVGKAAWGEESDRVGRLQERLGFEVMRLEGHLQEAKRLLERAIRTYEKRYGRSHLWIAYASMKLGFVLWDLQDLPRARAAFQRARRIFEATEGYGPEHHEVARVLTGLGQVFVDERKLSRARECQENALAIFKKKFGDRDLEVARTLDKLGYVAREQRALEEARDLHLEALAIFREVFDHDNHPEVAFVLTNLGLAYRDLGLFAEAREHQSQAIPIFDRFKDHRFSVIVRGRLAELPPPP